METSNIVCNIPRLHSTRESVDEAIKKYRDAGGAEKFFVFPLENGFVGDPVYLLRKYGFRFQILPCSLSDQFNGHFGKHTLKEEKEILNGELKNKKISFYDVSVIVFEGGSKVGLDIDVREPLPPISLAVKSLPFIGTFFPEGVDL